jgi:hypothetical protein
MSDDRALLDELGRLDPARKMEFLAAAKRTVAQFNAARDSRTQRAPTREDYEALEEVAHSAKRLYDALALVERLGLPAERMREAWIARQNGTEKEPPPNVEDLLFRIAQAALWSMPEKRRPAHRPEETWSDVAILVSFLAGDFHHLFGRPTLGNGSPFVKFCRAFLPANRIACPHLDTLTKIVERTIPRLK